MTASVDKNNYHSESIQQSRRASSAETPQDKWALKDSEVTSNNHISAEYDYSLVGQPISVSEMVKEICKNQVALKIARRLCQDIATMQQQPRDLVWAPQVEKGFENLYSQENPAGFKYAQYFNIISVECRSTYCFVDISATTCGNINAPPTMDWYTSTNLPTLS